MANTERVEIRPGHFVKMDPADKKAWLATQRTAAEQNAHPVPQPAERATTAAPETAVMPASRPRANPKP